MAVWVLCIALALVPACLATPHYDGTGKIGVLCIGDTSHGESPILGWLSLDFAVQWQELPTDVGGVMSDEAARKITRIYTPRTLERLLEGYDFLLLLEPRMEWFSGREMKRFKDSVGAGVGSLLTLWPDAEGYLSLVNSDLSEVYPQRFHPNYEGSDNLPYTVQIVDGRPPVLIPFIGVGIERFPGQKARTIHPKQGTTIWAKALKAGVLGSKEDEYVISWEYGEDDATTWIIGVDVDEQWFRTESGNEYGGDMVLNVLYYSVGKPLPPSLQLIHGLRSAFYRYDLEKKLVFSMMEFIDRFGANTASLEVKISEADGGKLGAERAYLEGDYEASYDRILVMISDLVALNDEAIRIKERALLWVYITEWSAVSGTMVLGGYVLYALMIRRRLYKEVLVTRATH